MSGIERLSPELMPLWRALSERFSAGGPVASVWVGPLTDREREAMADLFGWASSPPELCAVKVAELDAVLTAVSGRMRGRWSSGLCGRSRTGGLNGPHGTGSGGSCGRGYTSIRWSGPSRHSGRGPMRWNALVW